MKNQIIKGHMEVICNTIGARPTGSAANKAAVDYAAGVLEKCGLKVRLQEFECMDWRSLGAVLQVNGRDVPVAASEYSLPCDIEAEFICAKTAEELQNAALSGRIAVLHGELCKEPLMPKNFEFYNPDEHKQIIALLEEKKPAAIITVAPTNDHIIADGDFNIPCAVVSAEHLNVFTQSAIRRARLTINAERVPAKAHNVIATYGEKSEKVCFSAHIDTKAATPGALDNASGTAALLAFVESLSGKEFPFQIEIVLFNGEDYYSTPGEIAFMGNLTENYILAVNVDGVGLRDSATSVSFYSCSSDLESRIMERAEQHVNIERIEPWPMGDHMLFATYGIPTLAVTASNIFGLMGGVLHSPADNMKNIDLYVLGNTVRFLESCVDEWDKDMDVFYKQ